MLQIDRRRAGQRRGGERRITNPEGGQQARPEPDGGAVVAVVVWVVVALVLARVDAVGARRVEQLLDAVDGADEAAAAHEHDRVMLRLVAVAAEPAAMRAVDVGDFDPSRWTSMDAVATVRVCQMSTDVQDRGSRRP
jgi:hypothetical protein